MTNTKSRLQAQRGILPKTGLPLFEWAASDRLSVEPVPVPRAAQIIARRFALPIHIAAVVAAEAGLGGRNL